MEATMGKRLNPTADEVARLRELMADPQWSQREVAEMMGWPLRRVERLVPRLGLTTHKRGRFRGDNDARWQGGRIVDKDGYALIYYPDHPYGRKHSHYVFEHRLVMEQTLGRKLKRTEVVHHKNGDKQDNRPENLQLFASNADHLRHELTGRVPNWTQAGRASMLRAVRSRHRKP
jgi:HNH endonuclease